MFRLSASNAPSQSVTLGWDPSIPATDVAGYTIYYGVSPRSYTNLVDVGLETTGVVPNLVAGAAYYFAVTSHTSSDMESDFSSEIVWQSQSSLGLRIQPLP